MKIFSPEPKNEQAVPEIARSNGYQFDGGRITDTPAALADVARGIMGNHSPSQFMDSVNAAQSGMGNRAFMQVVDRLQGGGGAPDIHGIAAQGVQGPGRSMTHLDTIQKAFGHHNVSAMREYTGKQARTSLDALDAAGYSSGGRMAFGGTPDLYSQAHEAAHGVQQAALGSNLKLNGGVGRGRRPV